MNASTIQFESVNCDLCGGKEHEIVISMSDHFFHLPGTFNVVQCKDCGLKFTNPRPTAGTIVALYENYYENGDVPQIGGGAAVKSYFRRNYFLRSIWHKFCDQYLSEMESKASGKVLEIGCGTGWLMKELAQKGCEPYGVELNPSSAKVCQEGGLNVFCGNLEDAFFKENYFDTVILWHVMEHLPSPSMTLETIWKLLKPGGKVFIYSPHAESYLAGIFKEYWCGWHIPFHFYHLSGSVMKRFAEKFNFRVASLRTVTPEYLFPYSLASRIRDRGGKCMRLFLASGLLKNILFRLFTAICFRFFDFVRPGKGECLQVELVKQHVNNNFMAK